MTYSNLDSSISEESILEKEVGTHTTSLLIRENDLLYRVFVFNKKTILHDILFKTTTPIIKYSLDLVIYQTELEIWYETSETEDSLSITLNRSKGKK